MAVKMLGLRMQSELFIEACKNVPGTVLVPSADVIEDLEDYRCSREYTRFCVTNNGHLELIEVVSGGVRRPFVETLSAIHRNGKYIQKLWTQPGHMGYRWVSNGRVPTQRRAA